MEIIKTNKSGDKLRLDGYMYVRRGATRTRRQCTPSREQLDGRGGLTTDDIYENPESLVIHKQSHTAVKQDMCDIFYVFYVLKVYFKTYRF